MRPSPAPIRECLAGLRCASTLHGNDLPSTKRLEVAVEIAIKFRFAPKADPTMEVGCLGCERPWEVKRSQLQDTTDLVCPSCGAVHPLRRQEVLQALQELLDVFWINRGGEVSGRDAAGTLASRA